MGQLPEEGQGSEMILSIHLWQQLNVKVLQRDPSDLKAFCQQEWARMSPELQKVGVGMCLTILSCIYLGLH